MLPAAKFEADAFQQYSPSKRISYARKYVTYGKYYHIGSLEVEGNTNIQRQVQNYDLVTRLVEEQKK